MVKAKFSANWFVCYVFGCILHSGYIVLQLYGAHNVSNNVPLLKIRKLLLRVEQTRFNILAILAIFSRVGCELGWNERRVKLAKSK